MYWAIDRTGIKLYLVLGPRGRYRNQALGGTTVAIDIRPWTYTTDDAEVYSRGVADYISDQVNGSDVLIGGSIISSGSLPRLPSGLMPRGVRVANAAGKKRFVVIFDVTAPLWVGTVTSINLQDGAGSSTAYSVYSRVGERQPRRAPQAV